MKKNIFIAAIAALTLSLTACQKDDIVPVVDNGGVNTNARVKSTSDLHGTSWTYSVSYADFLTVLLGSDFSDVENFEEGTLTFGLNFDGTYAHFSFPGNIEAYSADQQIFGVSYTYTYDGTTHTGYLEGMAEDANGNPVPAQLQFTYNDATDVITFNLNMFFSGDGSSSTLTLNFARNE